MIAGIRRLKALQSIHNDDFLVPCNVVNVNDQEAQILAMSENVARQSLTPIEEARAYATYFGLDIDVAASKFRAYGDRKGITEYAQKIGVAQQTIRKRIPLLWLIDEVQIMLERSVIILFHKENGNTVRISV